MKKVTINDVEFTAVSAIYSEFPEQGRRYGVLCHDLKDNFKDGDGVYLQAPSDGWLPSDVDNVSAMWEDGIVTDSETLESVENF